MATKRKKNKNGLYEIRRKVPPYKDKNGKVQVYKKFYGKLVKDAEQKYQDYIAGVTNQAPAFFDDEIETWLRDTFLPDPRLKPKTKQRYIDAYRNNLAPMKWISQKPVKDITYKDLQKAYNEMTCAVSSIGQCHKLLRLFFALLTQQGIIDRDPTQGVIIPKDTEKPLKTEIITFTDDEINRIKAYITRRDLPTYEQKRVDRLRLLLLVAMNTGMRTAEMLALTYDDITPDAIIVNKQLTDRPIFKDGKTSGHEMTISETKSERANRTIPINPDLWAALREHKKWHKKEMLKNGYRTNQVFTTSRGSLYDRRSLRHTLDRIHTDAKVPTHGLHTYRRTFASKLARAGVPIQVLSDLLGHEDITVTAKYYIGVSTEEKQNAVALL